MMVLPNGTQTGLHTAAISKLSHLLKFVDTDNYMLVLLLGYRFCQIQYLFWSVRFRSYA